MKRVLSLMSLLLAAASLPAQFSRADSLRGHLNSMRSCYDVRFYDLNLTVNPATQRISGYNIIRFDAVSDIRTMQVDLFSNLNVDKIEFRGMTIPYRREMNCIFIDFPNYIQVGTTDEIRITYGGAPRIAVHPPWDGGFSWKKDINNKPWVGVSCEGLGASAWWPLKDHLSDEPDSMHINITAPADLMAVCNGQLRATKAAPEKGWKTWEWAVTYPINSYNVTLNIADYVHWNEKYTNGSGEHDLDFYVLRENEEKAREQFQQVGPMLKCFEERFGEYPYWRDGYALVETSYLGMEHQGAIAYGNHYRPGYDGFDPLNLGWDYIIVHESGHEWWGNSVSARDHAELWIHESFCTYAEAVYVEYYSGKETAEKYLLNQRGQIMNFTPLVGPMDVNYQNWVGSDIYYKGAWMLHTLRKTLRNDELWWKTLKAFAEEKRNTVLGTWDVIRFFNERLGKDFTPLWKQYLFRAEPPILEYKIKKSGKGFSFGARWIATEPGFRIPVVIASPSGQEIILDITDTWSQHKVNIPLDKADIQFRNFYSALKDIGKKKEN